MKLRDRQPTIVVGDIHGVHEIVDPVLATGQPVVFIGDYLDSYDRGIDDQLQTLHKVLTAVVDGKAVALMGNHELSYLDTNMRCSGFNSKLLYKLRQPFRGEQSYLSAMRQYLKPYHFAEGFLISHAGVSRWMLDRQDISLREYLDDEQFDDIGRARGGWAPVGGLYWCDWDEEFIPLPKQPQIVGHSRRVDRVIGVKGNSYCIDVLEHNNPLKTVVEIKDGGLTERKIDTR